MLDLIVLHGEFSLFTVRGNFWYQIYRNRRKKVLCSRLSLITLTNTKLYFYQNTKVLIHMSLIISLKLTIQGCSRYTPLNKFINRVAMFFFQNQPRSVYSERWQLARSCY